MGEEKRLNISGGQWLSLMIGIVALLSIFVAMWVSFDSRLDRMWEVFSPLNREVGEVIKDVGAIKDDISSFQEESMKQFEKLQGELEEILEAVTK